MINEYVISYATGSGGTWISWLINQHTNFPKIRLEEDDKFYDKISSDDIGTFHFGIAARRPLYDNLTSTDFFNLFLQKNPEAVDNFTKYSYKPSPHAPASLVEYFNNTDNHIFDHNSSIIIIGIFSNTDVFISRNSYINSLFELYPRDKSGADYIKHNNEYCHMLHEVCNKQGLKSKIFDAGKLLFGDIHEYHRLCRYINEPPLCNYTDHVNTAIEIIWKKFMNS